MAANPAADTSFTRSLYIGRDKTAEVLKRKEAVEKELKAKREAKIREQNERMARAAQQKEAELRDRTRQRQQRELERQKAVLDRRCAALEKLNAKKTELLERTHQQASRMAVINQQKKKVYAFGSSTPRELSYLETIKHHQRANAPRTAPSEGGSTPSLPQTTQTAPSTTRMPTRFLVPFAKSAPGSSAMTRSVHGALGSGGEGSSHQSQAKRALTKKAAPPTKQTPSSIKRQRKAANDAAAASLLNNASMTQSLYAQRMAAPTAAARSPKIPAAPKQSPKRPATPNNKKTETIVVRQDNVEQKPPPVIRPRKAQQQQSPQEQKPPSTLADELKSVLPADEQLPVEKDNTSAEEMVPEQVIQQEIALSVRDLEEHPLPAAPMLSKEDEKLDESPIPSKEADKLDESVVAEDETTLVKEEESILIGLDDSSTLIKAEDESGQDLFMFDAGILHEKQMTGTNSHQPTLAEAITFDNHEFHSTDASKDFKPFEHMDEPFGQENNIGLKEVKVEESQQMTPSSKEEAVGAGTPPKSASPPAVIILPDQEEREARRRRLNEILQRTRQEAPANTNGTTTNIAANTAPSTGGITSASNTLVNPQKDASALAQDILAKHRHKFQQQKQQMHGEEGNSSSSREGSPSQMAITAATAQQKTPTTLANELAESGFFADNTGFYSMPGQVMDHPAIHGQMPFMAPHPTLTVISSPASDDEREHTLLKQQHPTPPEDPRMNGHELNGKAFIHPPEPTSADIIKF